MRSWLLTLLAIACLALLPAAAVAESAPHYQTPNGGDYWGADPPKGSVFLGIDDNPPTRENTLSRSTGMAATAAGGGLDFSELGISGDSVREKEVQDRVLEQRRRIDNPRDLKRLEDSVRRAYGGRLPGWWGE